MEKDEHDNDEYQYADLDGEPLTDVDLADDTNTYEPLPGPPPSKDVKRNALITIGIIVGLMMVYKVISLVFFSTKNEAVAFKEAPPIKAEPPIAAIMPKKIISPPPAPSQPSNVDAALHDTITTKVNAMELSQENVRQEMATMTQQLEVVNGNVNNLNNQLMSLNGALQNLADQIKSQELLLKKLTSKPKKQVVKTPVLPPKKYFIQAIIPGRAWLIDTNGSTITVREGTILAGYGKIQVIDATQGRVLTSSGQNIGFSPEDS